MAHATQWFRHDTNAKDDHKCMLLIDQLGLEGYGIFWILIETLREQEDYRYPMAMLPSLARKYLTSGEKMRAVVTGYGLFEVLEDGSFVSLSLLKRMEEFDAIRAINSLKGKKSAAARALKAADIDEGQVAVSEPPAEPKSNRGSTGVQPRLNRCSTERQPSVNELNRIELNRIEESREEEGSAEGGLISDGPADKPLDNPGFSMEFMKRAWPFYLSCKQGKPYKNRRAQEVALRQLFKWCGGDEEEAKAAMQYSITNGWQGLNWYFERKQKGGNGTNSDDRHQQRATHAAAFDRLIDQAKAREAADTKGLKAGGSGEDPGSQRSVVHGCPGEIVLNSGAG